MPNPNLTVSLLTPGEAPQYQSIRHETFRDTVNKILYTREPSEKTQARVVAEIKDAITDKGVLYLKCVDKATGDIIAGARWRYLRPKDPEASLRTDEELDADLSVPEPFDESDPGLFRSLFTLFHAGKRRHLANRPYYCLDTLVTHPNHHRRGAGSMLIEWGTTKADEAGVECYLEASPMGEPLYAKHGFERLEEVGLNLRGFGGDVDELRFIVSPFGSTRG
ncbi:acyl-CoA N-acyltransferase [Corynespora cassiicola Philippines]|uniref:Acyl-CoA N-acyltransferase n=1 Tax=Corynespora cassiicola Philippines TaxID=1448308 RepID=A0A2T2N7I6_CORCC|nr:acyl-CoA N-acyltransferase [Corynespora cassiicola Philippines]